MALFCREITPIPLHRRPKIRIVALLLIILGPLLFGTGCSSKQLKSFGHKPPADDYRLVVLRPEVKVSELTMGGVSQPREDWTNQARENIYNALEDFLPASGETLIAKTLSEAGGNQQEVYDLISLHRAVGESILVHKVYGWSLPTKWSRFDWTLGDTAVKYGVETGFDYALFIQANSSVSTTGRRILTAGSIVGCVVAPVCLLVGGGARISFASLVDLKTGNVTWFSYDVDTFFADLRKEKSARSFVKKLLGPMLKEGVEL